MTITVSTEEAAAILIKAVLEKIVLTHTGKVSRNDYAFNQLQQEGKLHLVAVLRRTGWIRDGNIAILVLNRLIELAIKSYTQLTFNYADHVNSPAALAWLMQQSSTEDDKKEFLRSKLDGDTYVNYLAQGEDLLEKFYQEFLEICAGF